ncbi:MAG TPA: hypothetical protein VKE74_16440 [Gemmataceae bacterium]|nr:hypothetical protein [Gemmataceae bacterium]
MRHFFLSLLVGLFACACGCDSLSQAAQPPDVPAWAKGMILNRSLSDPKDAGELVFSDPAVWKFTKDADGKGCLELAYDTKKYKSTYSPKHRSPVHIALFKQYTFTDFVMDVEVMSTVEPYGHQDACLFFGFQDPEHYNYTHLAPAPDMNAHNIFIVNEAPRKNLLDPQKKGIEWKKDTWHKLRLVRQASTGKIEVYFDDFTKPVLAAEDKTFPKGFAGFGSFDDTARFRNARLYTKVLNLDKQADFFKPVEK